MVTIHKIPKMEKARSFLAELLHQRETDDRILIYARTEEQMNSELLAWKTISGMKLTILPLLQKSELLSIRHQINNNTIVSGQERPTMRQLNKLMLNSRRSGLLQEINQNLQRDPSLANFRHILTSLDNNCYHTSWSMLGSADIIVANDKESFDRVGRELRLDSKRFHIITTSNIMRKPFHSLKRHHLLLFMKIFHNSEFLQKVYNSINGLKIFRWEQVTDDYQSEIKLVLDKVDQLQHLIRTDSKILKQLPPKLLRAGLLTELSTAIKNIFFSGGTVIISLDIISVVDVKSFGFEKVLVLARKRPVA